MAFILGGDQPPPLTETIKRLWLQRAREYYQGGGEMSDTKYYYCNIHGEVFSTEDNAACPDCELEWTGPLEPGDIHYPEDEDDD